MERHNFNLKDKNPPLWKVVQFLKGLLLLLYIFSGAWLIELICELGSED